MVPSTAADEARDRISQLVSHHLRWHYALWQVADGGGAEHSSDVTIERHGGGD